MLAAVAKRTKLAFFDDPYRSLASNSNKSKKKNIKKTHSFCQCASQTLDDNVLKGTAPWRTWHLVWPSISDCDCHQRRWSAQRWNCHVQYQMASKKHTIWWTKTFQPLPTWIWHYWVTWWRRLPSFAGSETCHFPRRFAYMLTMQLPKPATRQPLSGVLWWFTVQSGPKWFSHTLQLVTPMGFLTSASL